MKKAAKAAFFVIAESVLGQPLAEGGLNEA
jgi:hypothetical protein